jgi:hypothetical protein
MTIGKDVNTPLVYPPLLAGKLDELKDALEN